MKATLKQTAVPALILMVTVLFSLTPARAATAQKQTQTQTQPQTSQTTTNRLVWNKMENQTTTTNKPEAGSGTDKTAGQAKEQTGTPKNDTDKQLAEDNLAQNTWSVADAIPRQADYVYSYMNNEVYRVYAKVDRIVDIQLQPGEEIIYIGGSDTVRWIIDKDISGSGATKQYHLFVKPQKENISTSLVITTDRHVYHLELYSKDFATPIINWNYPSEDKLAFQRQQEKERQQAEDTLPLASRSMTLENLNFKYAITGGTVFWRSVPWKPQLVFDDGEKTYIQIPQAMKSSEAPALFVKEGNDLALVNYRVKKYDNNTYYVVDRLADIFEMRVGKGVVTIKKQIDAAPNGSNK